MQVPLVDLQAQFSALREPLLAAIERTMAEAHYILGDEVARFEQEFAAYCGARYAIGVSSGTAALKLALMALDARPGDEVIFPANTFPGAVLAATALGLRAILVDVDPSTANIELARLTEAIGPRTRAVVAVHLYGRPLDLAALARAIGRSDIPIVEDASQAHGAQHAGRRVGSLGTIGCFSLYPSKNLGAAGDAGVCTTNDPLLAQRLGRLRNYGQAVKGRLDEAGFNARLDTLQAAILRVKLPHLNSWNQTRRRHATAYRQRLADQPLEFFAHAEDDGHVYHLFVVCTPQRDALAEHLRARGIGVGVHYDPPVAAQPALEGLLGGCGHYPVAERLARESLSLPMYPELSSAQIDYVCDAIRGFFRR